MGRDKVRYMVKISPEAPAVQIRLANLQRPGRCPVCDWEVASSECFVCSYGFVGDEAFRDDDDR